MIPSVGPKDLGTSAHFISGPFHIKPKAHAEEEEVLEDEQGESRRLGYIAEDDPVLDRPKSRKGKTPRC